MRALDAPNCTTAVSYWCMCQNEKKKLSYLQSSSVPRVHFASALYCDYDLRDAVYTFDDLYQANYAHEQWPAVGTVNGHGYNVQQKDAICDAHRPCRTIRSTLKRDFRRFQHLLCLRVALMPTLVDVEIWRF